MQQLLHDAAPLLHSTYQFLEDVDLCHTNALTLIQDGEHMTLPPTTPATFIQLYRRLRELMDELKRLKVNQVELSELSAKLDEYKKKVQELEAENTTLKRDNNTPKKNTVVTKRAKKESSIDEGTQAAILEALNEIKDGMATKSDLGAVRAETDGDGLRDLKREVALLRRDVNSMKAQSRPLRPGDLRGGGELGLRLPDIYWRAGSVRTSLLQQRSPRSGQK